MPGSLAAGIESLGRICWKVGVLRWTMCQLASASRWQFSISVIQPDSILQLRLFHQCPCLGNKVCWRCGESCSLPCNGKLESRHCSIPRALENHRSRTPLGVAVGSVTVLMRRCNLQTALKELLDKLHQTLHGFTTRGQGYAFNPFCPKSRSGLISFSNWASVGSWLVVQVASAALL